MSVWAVLADFYPRPPRGGRHTPTDAMIKPTGISIHALREEGDRFAESLHHCNFAFLSTPSARRATPHLRPAGLNQKEFLSTPSARRATSLILARGHDLVISIHALREEGDRMTRSCRPGPLHFYPRPPRGGRRIRFLVSGFSPTFLSTPSARRATDKHGCNGSSQNISIHALREEGDAWNKGSFQSICQFLSTPSARRATYLAAHIPHIRGISIHALREEGDQRCPL